MSETMIGEVQRLVTLVGDLGMDEGDLGYLVLALMGRARAESYNSGNDDGEMDLAATDDNEADADEWHEAYYKRGIEINCGGMEAQALFLAEQLGVAHVEEVIRELVSRSPFAFRIPEWG